MSATTAEARKRGWVEAAPGYWAWGGWRIQRGLSGWTWWYVVAGGPRGRAKTMKAAVVAVHRESEEP